MIFSTRLLSHYSWTIVCCIATASFFTVSGAGLGWWPGATAPAQQHNSPTPHHRTHAAATLADSTINATICGNEAYIFEGDTLDEAGQYTATYTAEDGSDSTLTLNLTVLPVLLTHDTLSICAGDTVVFNGDTLTVGGIYTDTLTASTGCDSIDILTLNVHEVFADTLDATICAGETYIFEGDTLSEAGTYSVTLESSLGCDSTLTLNLTVAPVFTTLLTSVICAGEAVVFNGDTLTVSGIYTDSLTSTSGCDSVAVLDLTVLPAASGALNATICAGETYIFAGDTLNEAGTYTAVLTAANGCDSTLTLTLDVLPTAATVLEATICAGDSYDYAGQSLTESGAYEFGFEAANGCDSTVTVALTVLPTSATTLDATVCEGDTLLYAGEPLTETGAYEFSFTSANGCDSTVTVQLTALPALSSGTVVTLCFGESLVYESDTLSDSGTYVYVLDSEAGCDSTVVLTINVLPEESSAVSATICAGNTYTVGGETFSAAGIYTVLLSSEFGCDSTVTLTLDVLPTAATAVSATICAGEIFSYNGQPLSTAGTYEFGFEAANGCDSTVTLTLNVLPVYNGTEAVTLCFGETFTFNDSLLTASGAYEFVFESSNGCDSTVTVAVTVLPEAQSTLTVQRCDGDTYVFDGDTLSTSGTYTALLTSAAGCDSLVTLDLTFLSEFETAISASICAGETYPFGTETLSESGIYTQLLSATGGCDSLVTLTLTVIPAVSTSQEATICANETYIFNGTLLNEGGTYTAALTSVLTGCDSTVVLTLTVLPTPVVNLQASICAGETYPFDGASLNASGTYTATHPAANGCDSVTVLSLTVFPAYFITETATICAGESLDFNGEILTETGDYTAYLTSVNGCDSTVILSLNVTEVVENVVFAATCAGTPFQYNGQNLTDEGVYVFLFENGTVNGCDSTVILDLSVLPTSSFTLVVNLCAGDSYEFGGQNLTEPGTYLATFEASNGCDSTVTLQLSFEPIDLTVELDNGTLSAAATNVSYQWIDCDNGTTVPGANASTFTPDVTGTYGVVITTPNGCVYTSDCQLVEVVGVSDLHQRFQWNLQPNPARESTTLLATNTSLSSDASVQVYDLTGRLLQSTRWVSTTQTLDLSALPSGVLLVRLTNANQERTLRLVRLKD